MVSIGSVVPSLFVSAAAPPSPSSTQSKPEHVLDLAADHLLVLEPGELEAALADVEQPSLLVADEESRLRGRVVVVQELEQIASPHREQALGRFDIPAVRSLDSSRLPQFGQMKKGTPRG